MGVSEQVSHWGWIRMVRNDFRRAWQSRASTTYDKAICCCLRLNLSGNKIQELDPETWFQRYYWGNQVR